MSNWSEGYVSDIGYIYGYYDYLNPARLTIPFLMAGIAPPEVQHACELGFGQGISVNIHAAAGNAQWHATDFNPAQAAFARHLAGVAGTLDGSAYLSEQGFNEFCARADLPDFDYIGLHGIWSWVSDDNRRILVDFIRRKLKPGGVLYISYNTLPGWAAYAPIRHLLSEYGKELGSRGLPREVVIRDAIRFGEEVLANSPQLVEMVPRIRERFKKLESDDSSYLAHEYLNQSWQPMYFAEVENWLSAAKLSFACFAHGVENFAVCQFDEAQTAFLNQIPSASFAQTVGDFLTNRQFRRDYWVKGKRLLNPLEIEREWHKLRVMLIIRREDYSPAIGNLRTTDILPELAEPVLDALADGKMHSVAGLQQSLAGTLDKERLFLVLALLFTKGDVTLCADDKQIAARRDYCRRFNAHVIEQASHDINLGYLASPVSGGGVALNLVEKLFLLAQRERVAAQGWADFVWQKLQAQGRKMLKEGVPLESEEDNLAEIRAQQADFENKRLPVLRRLQCVA